VCRKVPYDLAISPSSERDGYLKVPTVAKMLVLLVSHGSVLSVLTLFNLCWAVSIIIWLYSLYCGWNIRPTSLPNCRSVSRPNTVLMFLSLKEWRFAMRMGKQDC